MSQLTGNGAVTGVEQHNVLYVTLLTQFAFSGIQIADLFESEWNMGTLTLEIDDDLLEALGNDDASRKAFALEAIAVDCFQTKEWSTGACGRLMGIPRVEFVAIKMKRGLPSNLTGQDLVDGYQAIEKLFTK